MFLIVWSIVNILSGSIIFGIPALVFSSIYYSDEIEYRILAISLNIIATLFWIILWTLVIVNFKFNFYFSFNNTQFKLLIME